jgi:hypothetical protein
MSVKSELAFDHVPPAGLDRPEMYDATQYDFIRARLDDNPIYANDKEYRRTLAALPEHLRRAFLDRDWNVFAVQYFDIFDVGRHTSRPEELRLEPWWPRWISIDWGFQHPSAVYWHCAVPAGNSVRAPWAGPRWETSGEVVRAAQAGDESASGPRIVTSKSLSKSNYVRHTRELAKQKARQT